MEKSGKEVKFPDYMLLKYTDYDPLNLKVMSDGKKEIKLMTYRQAVPEGVQRKGVLFYIHGFGAYCEQKSFVFLEFAKNGYETFALDQRGFGNSEGTRGYFEGADTLNSDVYLFITTAIEKYNIDPKQTPLFLFGQSMGGLLSFNLSVKYKDLFKGMVLIVPFFRAFDKKFYKFQWVVKGLNFISPKLKLGGKGLTTKEYREKYHFIFEDPKKQNFALVSSLVMFKELQDFAKKNVQESTTPFLLITAKHDKLVNNQASEEIVKLIDNPLNRAIEFEESDHLSILVQYEEAMRVAKEAIAYYDSLINKD